MDSIAAALPTVFSLFDKTRKAGNPVDNAPAPVVVAEKQPRAEPLELIPAASICPGGDAEFRCSQSVTGIMFEVMGCQHSVPEAWVASFLAIMSFSDKLSREDRTSYHPELVVSAMCVAIIVDCLLPGEKSNDDEELVLLTSIAVVLALTGETEDQSSVALFDPRDQARLVSKLVLVPLVMKAEPGLLATVAEWVRNNRLLVNGEVHKRAAPILKRLIFATESSFSSLGA